MVCPICGGKTQISSTKIEIDHVRRKRMCLECLHRFYTIEVDEDMAVVLAMIKAQEDDGK